MESIKVEGSLGNENRDEVQLGYQLFEAGQEKSRKKVSSWRHNSCLVFVQVQTFCQFVSFPKLTVNDAFEALRQRGRQIYAHNY